MKHQQFEGYGEFDFTIFLLPRFPPRRTHVLEVIPKAGIEGEFTGLFLARKNQNFKRVSFAAMLLRQD